MLTVEERFMIKEWYRKGLSISEIARLTGHDRKTIRNILNAPLLPVQARQAPRARKIGPFVPYLEGRIAEGVLNARKLYGEIQLLGYPGKETQVRAFVQPFREARQSLATLRFETEPGEQAQVDWGHFGLINHYGRQRRLYGFVMTLGWSRAMYLEFTVSADAAWFLRCHLHAFDYLGGCPRQILHDNLKTAVLSRDADGTIHWKPRYLDFADYYGFTPRFLFQLVSRRYQKGSIILTSNKSYGDWGDIFADQVLAAAILDRLLHFSTTINIRGQSYRLREKRKAGVFHDLDELKKED